MLLDKIVEVFGILMGGLIVFLIGIFDDIKGARARFKFIIEILAACLVYYAGVRIDMLSNPFSDFPFHFGIVIGLPFTIIWIVGITNAINLSDGIDGLTAGSVVTKNVPSLCNVGGDPAKIVKSYEK